MQLSVSKVYWGKEMHIIHKVIVTHFSNSELNPQKKKKYEKEMCEYIGRSRWQFRADNQKKNVPHCRRHLHFLVIVAVCMPAGFDRPIVALHCSYSLHILLFLSQCSYGVGVLPSYFVHLTFFPSLSFSLRSIAAQPRPLLHCPIVNDI